MPENTPDPVAVPKFTLENEKKWWGWQWFLLTFVFMIGFIWIFVAAGVNDGLGAFISIVISVPLAAWLLGGFNKSSNNFSPRKVCVCSLCAYRIAVRCPSHNTYREWHMTIDGSVSPDVRVDLAKVERCPRCNVRLWHGPPSERKIPE